MVESDMYLVACSLATLPAQWTPSHIRISLDVHISQVVGQQNAVVAQHTQPY